MIKKLILLVLVFVVAYGIYYVSIALPVISAYGAKNICSCVFLSGRTPQSVIDNELNSTLLSLGSFELNEDDQSITGNVFGLSERKAIYRKGLGCTLVNEIEEEELRAQKFEPLEKLPLNPDTIYFPMGDLLPDTLPNGFNQEVLEEAINKAFNDESYLYPAGTRSVVVVYKNQLIGEQYLEEFNKDVPQLGWSMTKSVTGTIISLLIKDNRLSLEDQSVLTEWSKEDDPRSEISLDDLMRMSSGLEWSEIYAGPSDATAMLFKRSSSGEFASEKPLEFEPGKKWYYSSGTTNILSLIAKKELGDDYLNFPRERVFNKIGMRSAVMEPDPSGTFVGSSFMFATPRDWARFGLLYLNDGVWESERILPEDWADYSKSVTKDSKGRYGAQFWLNANRTDGTDIRLPNVPTDAYMASGFQGQRVFIIPSMDLVIVRLGYDPAENFDFNAWLGDLLEAFKV
ncbi:MAG: serine hydrolase [Bacteroidota bacterium]